ncbi:MAG: hypothetical protein DWQ41_08600 [Planctomycetota bacterium]|nr:MAG: hypothetical protein DWQ41_08600 [Planctomycetota bacterium]
MIAWLHDYGRLALRRDCLPVTFLGWVQLAYLFTILGMFGRRFLTICHGTASSNHQCARPHD